MEWLRKTGKLDKEVGCVGYAHVEVLAEPLCVCGQRESAIRGTYIPMRFISCSSLNREAEKRALGSSLTFSQHHECPPIA